MKVKKVFQGAFPVFLLFMVGVLTTFAGAVERIFSDNVMDCVYKITLGIGLMLLAVTIIIIQGFFFYNIRMVRFIRRKHRQKKAARKQGAQKKNSISPAFAQDFFCLEKNRKIGYFKLRK